MPKSRAAKKNTGPARIRNRTPTAEELLLESRAVRRIRDIGRLMGFNTLSRRVAGIFTQYRRNVTNVHRRNNVYRALAGLLTYGLHRATPGTYYNYSLELVSIIREAYPSGDDEDWGLINQANRPTADVGVEDLFEDKP
ncbi:Hypp4527 [Branchiostoma lanceolatum]|uniref:Hypp4527 protein n=1 Tax=Branchiostoma lanceolatum TaxID=7740 RepID=A0A8K0EYB0_BRALA|nr:Hypp4527 [Branchiostoma lanceolatum]